MALDPGGIIAWIVVGLIPGFLAGQVMRGGGFGIVGDVIVGLVGAFIGGLLFSLLPGSSASSSAALSSPSSARSFCWRSCARSRPDAPHCRRTTPSPSIGQG